MQLQDFEIYRQLYEQRSINGVAKKMGFAQSNITARLQQLESEFDAHFFARSYQGIQPTAAGTQFYDYVLTVITATQNITHQLHTSHTKQQLIISELLFNYLVIDQHQFTLDQTEFQILGSTAIEQLTTPTVDQVITYAQFHHTNYSVLAHHRLAATFLTGTSQYQQLPLLVNSDQRCPFRARTLTFAKHHDLAIQEIDSWTNIINLVQTGQGVALLPCYLARQRPLQSAYISQQYRIPYTIYQRTQR